MRSRQHQGVAGAEQIPRDARDDCYGPVPAPKTSGLDRSELEMSQLEPDFIAGLYDPDRASRIISIQRLRGLKLPPPVPNGPKTRST